MQDDEGTGKRAIDIATEAFGDTTRNLKNLRIKHITRKIEVPKWFDKLSTLKFFHIFLVWMSVIIIFGLLYFTAQSNTSYLLHNVKETKVNNVMDSIYFSFITATSTGFGDIVPVGIFKIVAIIEIVFGLLLLAFVTSKLVSLKQDVILSEIYDISFHERINELRSSLLVFRQNLNRVITRIDDKKLKKKELKELYSYISPLEIAITEISMLLSKKERNVEFTKNIDPLNAELIFTSIIQSIEKITELVSSLNDNVPEWRKEINLKQLENCMSISEVLFEKAISSKILPKANMLKLEEQKDIAIGNLRVELNKKR